MVEVVERGYGQSEGSCYGGDFDRYGGYSRLTVATVVEQFMRLSYVKNLKYLFKYYNFV